MQSALPFGRYLRMSNPLLPPLFSLAALLVLWPVLLLLLRTLNRQWWHGRAVRHARLWAPLVAIAAIGLWTLGVAFEAPVPAAIGATASAAVFVLLVALLIALPVSGLVLTGERIADRVAKRRNRSRKTHRERDRDAVAPRQPPEVPDTGTVRARPVPMRTIRTRRRFLTSAAAMLPAATMSGAGYGLVASGGAVRTPIVPLRFQGLHPDLEGLRVLHLTDLHLGYYNHVDDLEALLTTVAPLGADLVLVSGDIADDLSQLPDALRMISELRPRYGVFATLGNHEYYAGIARVLRTLEHGPIPLLRNSGMGVRVGRAELYVGGADDPAVMGNGERNRRFLMDSVRAAFDGAPSEAFHLLMSHRPEGFDAASAEGIALTVAGHTHGGQLGINGRSMLEPFMPNRYMWGRYERGASQLYTSAGVGHWFPFRLGCPAEAPLYELRPA